MRFITTIGSTHCLLFCLAMLLFDRPVLSAQAPRDLPYFSANAASIREKLAAETALSIHAKFQEPEQFNKESKTAYRERRERLAEAIATEVRQESIPDDVIWPFLKDMLATIVQANPDCAGTKIILTTDPTPNAYSIGDGTIIVHTGLLAGLENEDQLAFVLCHEIAHFRLEHATKGLVQEIKTLYSKEFKDKVKAAEQVEYNRNEQLENIYQSVLFNSRYHRRDLERQADSLAYRLFLKTHYHPAQANRLMALFEDIDEPLRDSSLQIATHFGCGLYPFQTRWLEKSQGSVWAETRTQRQASEKAREDSLRTHPDWQNRLRWIEAMSVSAPADTSNMADSEIRYKPIKYLSTLESVEGWWEAERYDQTLYQAMQYQKVYPDCAYLQEIQVLSLHGLYTHSKDHDLANVLSKNSSAYSDKYNQLLDFLNNLRLKELLALEDCSLEALPSQKTEYGLLAAYYMALAKEDRGIMLATKREYLSNYRKGRFAEFFKNRP